MQELENGNWRAGNGIIKSGGAMLKKETFLESFIKKRGTQDLDCIREWCASMKQTDITKKQKN